MEDGRVVTPTLFRETMEEELLGDSKSVGIEAYKKGKFAEAKTLFEVLTVSNNFERGSDPSVYEQL